MLPAAPAWREKKPKKKQNRKRLSMPEINGTDGLIWRWRRRKKKKKVGMCSKAEVITDSLRNLAGIAKFLRREEEGGEGVG